MKRLLDYIQGGKKGKKAHDLEREAMEDPFLKEAMDGYDKVQGKHEETIARLQQLVLNKTRKNKSYASHWYVAASVVVFISIGIGVWMMNREDSSKQEIAYQGEQVNRKENSNENSSSVGDENRIQKNNETTEIEKPFSPPQIPLAINSNKEKSKEIHSLERFKRSKPEYMQEDTFQVSGDLAYSGQKNQYEQHEILAPAVSAAPVPSTAMSRAMVLEENKVDDLKDISDRETLAFNEKSSEKQKDQELLLAKPEIRKKKNTQKADKNMAEVTGGMKESDTHILSGSGVNSQLVSAPVTGIEKYDQYINENMNSFLKKECKESKGTVRVRFSINANGRPENIRIIRSLCKSADEYLIELVRKGSDWTGDNGEIRFTR